MKTIKITNLPLIFIIYSFYFHEFVYLLKCLCNPQTDTRGVFVHVRRHRQRSEKFELPGLYLLSQLRLKKVTLCLFVSALIL